jgi:hypothetical protein
LPAFKTLLTVILIWCVSYASFSQGEFQDGFIVKEGEKYIYGYVSQTNTPNLTCLFKESKEALAITYTADQIAAYGILNGNHFRSRSITLTGESLKKNRFVEAVADGIVVLYHTDGRIFIERGVSFYELKNEKGTEGQYRSIIVSLLSDCEKVSRKAKSVPIEINRLKELVQDYNSCLTEVGGIPKSRRSQQTRSNTQLQVFTGLERTNFLIINSNRNLLNNKVFTDRTLVSGGLNFLIKPKESRHVSFVTGLWYNQQKLYLVQTEITKGTSDTYIYRADYSLVRFPLFIQIDNLIDGKVEPYLRGGFSFPLRLNGKLMLNQETEKNNSVYLDHYEIIKHFKEPIQLHVSVGASLPLSNGIYFFTEVLYSTGKNKFSAAAPVAGEAGGSFKSIGINVGLMIQRHAD